MLPSKFRWLEREPGPKMLLEAIKLHGIVETPGPGDNPVIMRWAQECNIIGYTHDSVAWCGLAMAVCAKRAGWVYKPLGNPLWALNWAEWGNSVPTSKAMLGDVVVFKRYDNGKLIGGHVGQYVGESDKFFWIIGGNQADAFSIRKFEKLRVYSVRRAPWRISQPKNVRKIYLEDDGSAPSSNEA